MLVYRNIDDVENNKETAVTVGTFDGVHLGHQAIIGKLKEVSAEGNLRNLIVTFEPHPQTVLRSKVPDIRILSTLEEKLSIFRSLEIDSVLVIEFTETFSKTGAEEFYTENLLRKTGMRSLVLGYDHMFGRNREGNFEMMKSLSAHHGFAVERVDEFKSNGRHISSTVVRKLLDEGNVEEAAECLGRHYTLSGTVTEGRKLGRELGMPTANLVPVSEFKMIPANGVYAVRVKLDGVMHQGVMSVGTNPTVSSDNLKKLEVNIFDFNEDVYGKILEVEFVKYIRPEEKYSNLDELKAKMNADKLQAMEILNQLINQ